jgi:hypothetical protein
MIKQIAPIYVILFIFVSCGTLADKDLSLSSGEYQAFQMPDPSKIWNQEDYWKAYGALLKVKNQKPYSLPRKGSNKSGEYFDRMTSMENFSFLNSDTLSLKEKAYRIQPFLVIQSELTDVYTNIYGEEQYYNRELIDLYLLGLTISDKMLELAKKINDSDDPEDRSMQSGYDAILFTFVSTIQFILEEQKNPSTYREEDLERLSDSISTAVLRNLKWLRPSDKQMIETRISHVVDSVSSPHVRKNYQTLLDMLP